MFHLWAAIRGLPARLDKITERDVKFFFQRLTRGWDDGETFSMDHSLAKLIAPRLRRFREVSIKCPMDMDSMTWRHILDTMIEGFEFIASDEYFTNEDDEMHDKAREALNLFNRYYYELWW